MRVASEDEGGTRAGRGRDERSARGERVRAHEGATYIGIEIKGVPTESAVWCALTRGPAEHLQPILQLDHGLDELLRVDGLVGVGVRATERIGDDTEPRCLDAVIVVQYVVDALARLSGVQSRRGA